MKYLKLKCKNGVTGPIQKDLDLPGSNPNPSVWIVIGYGIEVEYDSDGNELLVGTWSQKIGIGVDPMYRKRVCTDPNDDVVWGVAEIEIYS